MKAELKECQKERGEYLDGWQRAKADYINLKKESEESVLQTSSRVKQRIISEFLPIIDNFNLAWQDKKAWEETPTNWRLGIEHIYKQFLQTLTNLGVVEINQKNVAFDPNIHEAIETVEITNESEDNMVVEIMRIGYKLNDKIIRPAQVKVSQFKN